MISTAFDGHSTKRLFCLESYWTNLPVSNMSTDSTVVDFNAFEYNTFDFLSRLRSLAMDGLDLKSVEKAC